MIGQSIGNYRITAKLGEGGMGVVYRAHDTKLKRDVAIKVLPEVFARDPQRMARFEREAQLLAALSHPNIAAIYGIEGTALIMELVEGPTLAERIRRGAVRVDEVVSIAHQIAAGLDAAHEKTIIHRDLKPANIKVTPEGVVKILDFGLAKAMAPISDPDATVQEPLSSIGMVMGTHGYMSPEQARGIEVDKRTDIWAFGVVVYELLTGKRMFGTEGVADWSLLPDSTPPWLGRLLVRCVEMDRRKRLRDIAEAFVEEHAPQPPPPPPVPAVVVTKRGLPIWLLPVVAVACLVVGWAVRTPKQVEAPVRAFSFTPEGLNTSDFLHRAVISPNGKHIAYVAQNQLWIRDMADERSRPIDGTENARGPFWSPDSAQIAFAVGQQLKRVAVGGGTPFAITGFAGNYWGGAWSPDGGTVVVSSGPHLAEAPANGGPAKILLTWEAGGAFLSPQFVPTAATGRTLLASRGDASTQKLVLIDLGTAAVREIAAGAFPAYLQAGHILFQSKGRDTGLLALPFSKGEAGKQAFPLLDSGYDFSASHDGTVVYSDSAFGMKRIVWRDRAGHATAIAAQPALAARSLGLSPDGLLLAFGSGDSGNTDIRVLDLTSLVTTRFTFDPSADGAARWDPSGKEIAFLSLRSGQGDIFIQSSDGSGEPKRIVASPFEDLPTGWSPDGKVLMFAQWDRLKGGDLLSVHRRSDGSFEEPVLFFQSPFSEWSGQFSPDGRFVLYESNESGRAEVFVRSFPDGSGKRQVSAGGGVAARWSRDGREVFYCKDDALYAVPVSISGAFSAGTPSLLFRSPGLLGQITHVSHYDVAPDGKRFIIAEPVTDTKPAIHVIQNFPALLRQKLASPDAE